MAGRTISEQDKRELEQFGRMAEGMENRRKELLAEAHRRAELELHQYRMTVLNTLESLTKKHSVSQIVRTSGLARSTVYRWMERLRNERMYAEAAAKGITLEAVGGLGGFGSAGARDADLLSGSAEAPEPEKRTPEELGWRNIKKLVSGEVGGVDCNGHTWTFNPETGEGWNKTENSTTDGRANWPEGAEELVDSLK